MTTTPSIVRDLEISLRKQYDELHADHDQKLLDEFRRFVAHAQKLTSTSSILQEATKTIQWNFPFKQVCIALRGKEDGRFRYELMVGFTHEAEQALKKTAYSTDEIFDSVAYPGFSISRVTKLYASEAHPYRSGEEDHYNRPSLLSETRNSLDEFLEGDYLEIYFYDKDDQLLGWLELSGTKDNKMPPMRCIRWLEHFASIFSFIVRQEPPAEIIPQKKMQPTLSISSPVI